MKDKQLYDLIWMSRPLMQAAEAAVERGLAGTGLTVRMRAVLEMLRAHGDLTVPDIAARLEIHRQYVQLMVNDTLASGYAVQRPNPRHKRSQLVALTDSGRKLIDAVVSKEMGSMRSIGEEFSDEAISTALTVILGVTAKLKAQAGKDR